MTSRPLKTLLLPSSRASFWTLWALLALYLTPSTSLGRPSKVGLGLMVGSPTGVALQVPVTRRTAVNGSLYYDLRAPLLAVHADHIWLRRAGAVMSLELSWYYGLGGYVSNGVSRSKKMSEGWGELLVRAPLGGELGTTKLRAFAELSPALRALPDINVRLHLALGVRYHF